MSNLLVSENKPFVIKVKGVPRYFRISLNGKTILYHRYLMEHHIGRKLKRSEKVHHKNNNGFDNRIENLEIMTQVEHMRLHRPKNMIHCSTCNVLINKKPSRVKRNEGKAFCGNECAYKFHGRETFVTPCTNCQKEVRIWQGRLGRRKTTGTYFCSYACRYAYLRRPNKECSNCSKPIRVFPFFLKKNKTGRFFCTRKCRISFQKTHWYSLYGHKLNSKHSHSA